MRNGTSTVRVLVLHASVGMGHQRAAEALAQANDIRACRDAAQHMRRAGVALPPALIALAGLKLELLEGRAR